MTHFEELGIAEPILKSIREHGFSAPTYIQEKSISPIIEGKDVVGKSETGSGKTLAFGCGIIQNTTKGEGIRALVLTPTRELAEQVKDSLEAFSRHKKLKIVTVYGGVAINPQMDALKKADIVVATPGRMLDHMSRGTIDLSNVSMLVLDEADRMVDMGFIYDVKQIISACPKDRQTLLFSATLSREIKEIEQKYMRNPIRISAGDSVDPKKLTQEYYNVQQGMKFSLLMHLLKSEKSGLSMVFCNTKTGVDFVAKNLKKNGIDAVAIHGGFTQAKRSQTMQQFQGNKADVLVCTDVAARGLDIQGVTHIYNYDLPSNPKEYIHRIGRTARAGEAGKAIIILTDKDHDSMNRILSENDIKITKKEKPYIERFETVSAPRQDSRSGGRARFGQGGPRRSQQGKRPRAGPGGRPKQRDGKDSGRKSFGTQKRSSRTRRDNQ